MNISVESKFDIGSTVYRKQDILAEKANLISDNKFSRFTAPGYLIIEIHPIVCYAGIQVHYGVRVFQEKSSSILLLSEIELTASKEG